MNKIYHTYCVLVSQEQIRVILWWQQGSRKKIQTSLSSARSHVQLCKIGSCQINDDKVSIVHFHVLMSFYSIYAILSQIRFCRDLCFFCVNFWGQKLRLRKFFDKYDVCSDGQHWLLLPNDTKSRDAHRSTLDRPWLPNKSFPHFSPSLLNSSIYLPHVLSLAKSRINNVCVSFPPAAFL